MKVGAFNGSARRDGHTAILVQQVLCMVAKANGDALKRKAGAAIIAVRRGGAIHTFDTLNHLFISQMIVPGSSYWNIGHDPGDVLAGRGGALHDADPREEHGMAAAQDRRMPR